MSKKTSIIVVALLVAAAVFLGLVLVNKGDGPVAGMIMSDKTAESVKDFEAVKISEDSGVYLILEKAYDKFVEKLINNIPAGRDLYANIYLVECPKGSIFNVKWVSEGKTVKEETKELATDKKGVVTYVLDGSNVKSGNYTLEIHTENKKIFEHNFLIH